MRHKQTVRWAGRALGARAAGADNLALSPEAMATFVNVADQDPESREVHRLALVRLDPFAPVPMGHKSRAGTPPGALVKVGNYAWFPTDLRRLLELWHQRNGFPSWYQPCGLHWRAWPVTDGEAAASMYHFERLAGDGWRTQDVFNLWPHQLLPQKDRVLAIPKDASGLHHGLDSTGVRRDGFPEGGEAGDNHIRFNEAELRDIWRYCARNELFGLARQHRTAMADIAGTAMAAARRADEASARDATQHVATVAARTIEEAADAAAASAAAATQSAASADRWESVLPTGVLPPPGGSEVARFALQAENAAGRARDIAGFHQTDVLEPLAHGVAQSELAIFADGAQRFSAATRRLASDAASIATVTRDEAAQARLRALRRADEAEERSPKRRRKAFATGAWTGGAVGARGQHADARTGPWTQGHQTPVGLECSGN